MKTQSITFPTASREKVYFLLLSPPPQKRKFERIRERSWEKRSLFPVPCMKRFFHVRKDKGKNHKLMFWLVASGSTFIVLSARPSNPSLRLTRIEPSNHFDRATYCSNRVFREVCVKKFFISLELFFCSFCKLRVGLQGYFCKTYVSDAFLPSFCDQKVIPWRKIVLVLSVVCAKLLVNHFPWSFSRFPLFRPRKSEPITETKTKKPNSESLLGGCRCDECPNQAFK